MSREESEQYKFSPEAARRRSCVTTFQPRDGASPEQNLAEFVRMARDDLTAFGADLDWGHWSWKGVGMFLRHGCPRRVRNPDDWHMDPGFADFAKAYLRYEQGMNPTPQHSKRLAALRAIEHALMRERGSAPPTGIGLGTLDYAAQALREHFGKSGAYAAAQVLSHIARFLSRYGLTHNDVGTWTSPIFPPSKMHIKLGAEADAHRRAKLPDMAALNAIGAIFARGFDLADNVTHPDVYVTSVIAMLMAQPGRIGEIHELAIDLEIEQRDLEGGLQYGFRYRSFKSKQGTRIKWIPAAWAPLAREAVRRIREITEGPRAFARYVEAQLEARKNDPGAPMPFYRHAACPDVADDEPLTGEQAAAALGFTGKNAKSSICDRGLSSRRGAYTLNSLWQHVLERLPKDFPYVDGAGNKRLKYSEALFCMHINQLRKGHNPTPVSLWIPSQATLAPLLAPINPNVKGIFERHRVTREDGQPLRMNSHQLRHLLNTLGHEGSGDTFMDKDTINWWSGRDQAWQGVTYNHVPAEEIARRAGEALKKVNGGYGVIELPIPVPAAPPSHWSVTHPAPKSCADIEIHHRSAVLMTVWGGCEHDWMLEPCPFHQDCLNCKDHFCVKGFGKDDLERIARLRDLLAKVVHQQALARTATEAGECGASSYLAYQSTYRERIEQLISLLENPDVAEGAVIRLAGAAANSHLHRVLREVALRELAGMPEKKDVIDALVLAYRENLALPLDRALATPTGGDHNA